MTQPASHSAQAAVEQDRGEIASGRLRAVVSRRGWVKFYNAQGKELRGCQGSGVDDAVKK